MLKNFELSPYASIKSISVLTFISSNLLYKHVLRFNFSNSLFILSILSICLGIIIVKISSYFFFSSRSVLAQKISSDECVLAAHHIFLSPILFRYFISNELLVLVSVLVNF